MLLLTAFIWGTSFAAQRSGLEFVGPFTFNAIRCFIGGIVLLPVIYLLDKGKKRNRILPPAKKENRELFAGGVLCGAVFFAASSLQQVALVHTTAGKTGFINSLYVLFVPVLGLFLGKKVALKVWISVAAALVGLYFLCITEELSVNVWDLVVLLSAVAYSVHILVIDHYTARVDGVKMACIQYFVCGGLSLLPMLLLETLRPGELIPIWLQLIYAGAFSCGVAFTLQIVAQKYTEPAVASIILSVESVFALLGGFVLLGERLTMREWIGCAFMFAAIMLSQMPKKGANGKDQPASSSARRDSTML